MNKFVLPLIIAACFAAGCKKDDTTTTPSSSPVASPSTPATPSESPTATPAATDTPAPGMPDASKQIVGTWKVDMTNTTVPMTSQKDKDDAAKGRVEFKADGTFATSGGENPKTGKWTAAGDKITMTDDKGATAGFPVFTVLPDGSSISAEIKDGEKAYAIVFIKA